MTKSKYNITLAASPKIGYASYLNKTPFIKRLHIGNTTSVDMEGVKINLSSSPEFIVPSSFTLDLPAESVADIDLTDVALSPLFLSSLDVECEGKIIVEILENDDVVQKKETNTVLLAYDEWGGDYDSPEFLSAFVRPNNAQCVQIVSEAQAVLAKWKVKQEIGGYEGADKNMVRLVGAAVYTAIQNLKLKKVNEKKSENGILLRNFNQLFTEKEASPTELAVLYASCLEKAGLNSLVVFGKKEILVGFFLTDNCFYEIVNDDAAKLEKYFSDGVNEIALTSIKSLFDGGTLSYQGAEKIARQVVSDADTVEVYVDIKRARAGRMRSLPERYKTANGYDIFEDQDLNADLRPDALDTIEGDFNFSVKQSKEKQWERRLLDLSLKNTLLNFKPGRNAVHIMCSDVPEFAQTVLDGVEFAITDAPKDIASIKGEIKDFESAGKIRPLKDLLEIEMKHKRIRSFYTSSADLAMQLNNIYRKDRTINEETGANSLYIGACFLKWYEKRDPDNAKYAPLILLPISLIRKAAGKSFGLSAREDAFQLNTTLLEFLKQEFNIDIRGLEDCEKDIKSVIMLIKKQIIQMPNWLVTEDCYIASFSFPRFLMWNDLRQNIDKFRKNKLIKSLIKNRSEFTEKDNIEELESDEAVSPKDILLPINADLSQFQAIYDAAQGKSFVLHGPPGTGKSQTITNIIANIIAQGKTVLFVAEKMAALSVVKNRLEGIGVGDFSMEIYSNKTDKMEIVNKISATLDKKHASKVNEFSMTAAEISKARSYQSALLEALHKKRYLNISLYEGIMKYLENTEIGDYMDIENSFYENLSSESLSHYEDIISEVSATARECGEIYKSPFMGVNVKNYDENLVRRVKTALELFNQDLRYMREIMKLCFREFNCKPYNISRNKISALNELSELLTSQKGICFKLFTKDNAAEVISALNSMKKLLKAYTEKEKEYFTYFKGFPKREYEDEKDNSRLIKELNRLSVAKKYAVTNQQQSIKLYYDTVKIVKDIENLGNVLLPVLGEDFKAENTSPAKINAICEEIEKLFEMTSLLFTEISKKEIILVCKEIYKMYPYQIFTAYRECYQLFERAESNVIKVLDMDREAMDSAEDYFNFMNSKTLSIVENADLLPAWCKFNQLTGELQDQGLNFIAKPLFDGKIKSDKLINCFRKKVYANFIDKIIKEDELLNNFSRSTVEESIDKFRALSEQFESLTRKEIYCKLTDRLPKNKTEGAVSLENIVLQRAIASNMRGVALRNLFAEIPTVLKLTCPCMLMSPISVAQYLDPDMQFDVVIFDEASQMPTCEAIGAIARGKSVIVVGDPKQLPPTAFFVSDYSDEDNLENEDLDSILDDCLALAMPSKYLLYHYRSQHESLIAFSNAMYYNNKLLTFPSADALVSRVSMRYIENGIYDRGYSKRNMIEAQSLVEEVIRRLSDPVLKQQSIGVVTFSSVQQELIDNLLTAALTKAKLYEEAHNRKEPIFVKNLENVQGDERDIILFSVGYGPDKFGKLTLNFGPLNQAAGWRRLNVAVSRARREMVIFASMTSSMIDLNRTGSKGVAGLKAFLEYAEKGMTAPVVASKDLKLPIKGIGYHIAEDLQKMGFDCRYNIGVSGFKIDCAVLDPKNKKRFLLGIVCDGAPAYAIKSSKDRNILQMQILKTLGWNTVRVWTLNYINNPKREIKRIKDILDVLTGVAKEKKSGAGKYMRVYKLAGIKLESANSDYFKDEANEKDIIAKINNIVSDEEPIARTFLLKRVLNSYGLLKAGEKVMQRLNALVDKSGLEKETHNGVDFFLKSVKGQSTEYYRNDKSLNVNRTIREISPYEIIAAAKSVVEDKISIMYDDLIRETAAALGYKKPNNEVLDSITYAVDLGIKKRNLIKQSDDKVTL